MYSGANYTPNSAPIDIGGSSAGFVQESDSNEQFVEVTYNGNTFYVPQSMAYAYNSSYQGESSGLENEYQQTLGEAVNAGPVIPQVDESEIEWSVPALQRRTIQSIGIPEKIHEYFQMLDLESLRQMEPDDERYKELPVRYHSAQPLDDLNIPKGTYGSFGYPSSTYKVVDSGDNQVYLVRRLDNIRTSPAIIKASLSKWISVTHPCIVKLHGISNEKGALFFSYTYYAGAQTLRQRYIDQRGPLVNETLIWRILVQLISALRHIHRQHGLAARLIHPNHVILTSGTIARINSVGIMDITEFESRRTVPDLQRDDYIRLGYLAMSLGSRALITSKNTDAALDIMSRHFSPRLVHMIRLLLSGGSNGNVTATELANDNIIDEYDSSLTMCDSLHSHLANEYENGRILRLIIKLGFMNERPDPNNSGSSNNSSSWSENGDRYILKLFRDYVFHQNDSSSGTSRPMLDAGHVITSLNKLDAGSSEQIILCSRDNKDLIIVSFADVKRCLEKSMAELVQESDPIEHSSRPLASGQNRNVPNPKFQRGSSFPKSTQYSSSQPQEFQQELYGNWKSDAYSSNFGDPKHQAPTSMPSRPTTFSGSSQRSDLSASVSSKPFVAKGFQGNSATYRPNSGYVNQSAVLSSTGPSLDIDSGNTYPVPGGLKPTAQEWTPPTTGPGRGSPAPTGSFSPQKQNPQVTNAAPRPMHSSHREQGRTYGGEHEQSYYSKPYQGMNYKGKGGGGGQDSRYYK